MWWDGGFCFLFASSFLGTSPPLQLKKNEWMNGMLSRITLFGGGFSFEIEIEFVVVFFRTSTDVMVFSSCGGLMW